MLVLDYSRWCVRFTPPSVQKDIESKVRIHIHLLDEIYNIYFRTKNPNLDRNLDQYLRILDADGRGLI